MFLQDANQTGSGWSRLLRGCQICLMPSINFRTQAICSANSDYSQKTRRLSADVLREGCSDHADQGTG